MTLDCRTAEQKEVDWARECEHLMDFVARLQQLQTHLWYQRDQQYRSIAELNETNRRLNKRIDEYEEAMDSLRQRIRAVQEENQGLVERIGRLRQQRDSKNAEYQLHLSQLRESQEK